MSERHAALTSLPPILPRLIRRFAVVIVLLWLGFTAFVISPYRNWKWSEKHTRYR